MVEMHSSEDACIINFADKIFHAAELVSSPGYGAGN